jgi:hypothetical protein
VVKAKTVGRIQKLRARIGEGCPACKGWPLVWILGDDDPEPPAACSRCGRVFAGLVRVYVGVDPDDI